MEVSDFVLKSGDFLPKNTTYLYYSNHSFIDDCHVFRKEAIPQLNADYEMVGNLVLRCM